MTVCTTAVTSGPGRQLCLNVRCGQQNALPEARMGSRDGNADMMFGGASALPAALPAAAPPAPSPHPARRADSWKPSTTTSHRSHHLVSSTLHVNLPGATSRRYDRVVGQMALSSPHTRTPTSLDRGYLRQWELQDAALPTVAASTWRIAGQ
ncbi:hypothetical protein FH972_021387 [Carpinus fangiana]|uniref:Uncharacterized protein n=1 Tax=Carpinus fangiana TaxID=176857 RepID=A0A5N6KPJ2_9ROSI|nr:hypothetical protein FH972_021387 [Carpinus fangiana]